MILKVLFNLLLCLFIFTELNGQSLIPNHKFDNGDYSSWPHPQTGNCDYTKRILQNFIDDWHRAMVSSSIACMQGSNCPSPDWFDVNCPDAPNFHPFLEGNRWIQMVDQQGRQEGIRVKLPNKLTSGETYTLRYWVVTEGAPGESEHKFKTYLCSVGHFWDADFWAPNRELLNLDSYKTQVLSHPIEAPGIIPNWNQPVQMHWHQRWVEFTVPSDLNDLEHFIAVTRAGTHHFDDPELTQRGCDDPLIIDNTTFRPGVHHPYYGTPIQIGYNGAVISEGATLTFVSPIEVQINEINVPGNEAFHVYNAPCDCESPIANPGSGAIICANDPPYQLGGSSQEWMSYSWSCEPSAGLNYLNSTTVSNPVLTAPTTGNHELVYTVTVTNTCGVSLSEDVPIVIVNTPDNTPTLSVSFYTTEWPVKIWMIPDQWMETISIELYNYGGSTPVQTWDLLAFQDFQPGEDFFWEFQDILPICDGYTIKVKGRNMCSPTVWSSVETLTVEPFGGTGQIVQLSDVISMNSSPPNNAITLIHTGFVHFHVRVFSATTGILIHEESKPIVSNQVTIWDGLDNSTVFVTINGTYDFILLLTDCDGNVIDQASYWTVLNSSNKMEDPEAEETEIDNLELEQIFTYHGFNIHPNPNSGTFTISGTDMQQITIMEASGKLVRQMVGPFGTAVEVNGLGAGLYVVRVQMADGGVETGRVVVAP